MITPFYTIGHGTRPLHDFVELLKSVAVTLVVDVRTVPRSRTNPQYNRDALPKSLEPSEIGYEHIASLGGLRGRAREVPLKLNAFWESHSFHNYADYAMSDHFRDGLVYLRELGHVRRCAHVRGNRVVALSPTDHHRLPPRGRRERVSHSRT